MNKIDKNRQEKTFDVKTFKTVQNTHELNI